MGFIKHSEGQIGNVVESLEEIDDKKTAKSLKEAQESAKELNKDGEVATKDVN